MTPESELAEIFRLAESQQKALARIGLVRARDLLYHFPARYEEEGTRSAIESLAPGASIVLFGRLSKVQTRKAWKRKIPIGEGYLEDGTGRIKLMWFHQPYIAKMFPEGTQVKISGKVTGQPGKIYIANPAIERAPFVPPPGKTASLELEDTPHAALAPVYPETAGITSLWCTHAIRKLLTAKVHEAIEDTVPPEILERYHLPDLATAFLLVHQPKKARDAEVARKRFAFEEIFVIQIGKQRDRAQILSSPPPRIAPSAEAVKKLLTSFPFALTSAQERAIQSILADLKGAHPMSRLLEGDVGSGKTAVGAAAAYSLIGAGGGIKGAQVAYMAPTEILAKQHFASFYQLLRPFNIPIALLTGATALKFPSKVNPREPTKISRAQLLKWLAKGEIPLLIGTHALISEKVAFNNLALVIIDEQHRFGTKQRMKLAKKGGVLPHLLSMTATPIPRTLALTMYGDLDLTLLDEMPPGRKPVITKSYSRDKRKEAYALVRQELAKGRQAYVICPRIDEPDPDKMLAMQAKSVKEEAKRLKKEVFPEYAIEILHGKMTPKEKDAIMKEFSDGRIDMLAATSVVEVGVNVPNATVIMIEGAERFGLAQLHQLRGRVIRGSHQAYCLLFPESEGERTRARLKALETAKNGFELAEMDLKIRGAGELVGRGQSGISDVGMDALQNLKLVEAARTEAQALIATDPDLKDHPLLAARVEEKTSGIHFE